MGTKHGSPSESLQGGPWALDTNGTTDRLRRALGTFHLPPTADEALQAATLHALDQLPERLRETEPAHDRIERLKAYARLCRAIAREGESHLQEGGVQL